MSLWDELRDTYERVDISAPKLKAITLSQWALESGWGQSTLAQEHLNFGGLKFRAEMAAVCEPVDYEAHDGLDTYCKFSSIESFIRGYWVFIGRSPYVGWEEHAERPVKFLRHLADAGYATDPSYVEKVLKIYDKLHDEFDQESPGSPEEEDNSLFKLGIIVGHNNRAKGAKFHFVEPGLREWDFNKEVAEEMKKVAGNYSVEVKIFFRKPGQGSTTKEIKEVYRRSDEWGADATIELHFNSFDSTAHGTETWTSGSSKSRAFASAVQAEVLHSLELKDRKVKKATTADRAYTSVTAGVAPAILVEPFFGDNRSDCIAASALGERRLGLAYLRGAQAYFAG